MLKGVIFSVAIGLVAVVAEKFTPSAFNGILIALLLGMLIGNLFSLPSVLEKGINYTSAKMLELSILFLAVGINYTDIANLGLQPFLGVVLVVFAVLSVAYFLSKRFNCPGNTGILVGFGTAICGSSAIAALAPSLKNQNKEDVAIAMAVVNLLGTLGMLALPWVLLQIDWPSEDVASQAIGYLVGGSLHSVGNVAGAGFAIGKSAGDVAITVKLARVALLTPGLIFITYLTQRNAEGSWKRYFNLPWYLIGFVIVTFVVSMVNIPKPAIKDIEYIGKVVLTVAMAAIGLKVSFKKLLSAGSRGLRFGIVVFALQLGLLSLMMLLMR
jgi:uncharacterized integral membrane protein (TIGR00698 family)